MSSIDPTDPATCHELDKIVSYSFSTDRTQALVVCEDTSGKRVLLRFDVDKTKRFQSMLHEMARALERIKVDAGNVLLKAITRPPMIGHSDEVRGHVFMGFECGTQDESVYIVRDDIAMQMKTNIEYDISTRVPAPQRAMMTAGVRRIILPPGH